MDLQELQVVAPAAFSDSPAPHVSDRYQHVRTADIVEQMMSDGFTIKSASQQKTQKRTAGQEAFQKHRITMRMPTDNGDTRKLGSIFPTVNIVNSGNWSSTFIMAVGLYRLVCENGMIAPFGAANETIKIRHDRINEDTQAAIQRAIDSAPGLFGFAEMCQGTNLSQEQVRMFGLEAARLRFNVKPEDTCDERMVRGLLQVRRRDDAPSDLWSVFNRVQENGTHGGFKIPDANGRLRSVRARRSIAADTDWNQLLWGLTQDWASRMN